MAATLSKAVAALFDLMEANAWQQKDLASDWGCDPGHVSRILRMRAYPNLDLSLVARDRYGIDPGDWKATADRARKNRGPNAA